MYVCSSTYIYIQMCQLLHIEGCMTYVFHIMHCLRWVSGTEIPAYVGELWAVGLGVFGL